RRRRNQHERRPPSPGEEGVRHRQCDVNRSNHRGPAIQVQRELMSFAGEKCLRTIMARGGGRDTPGRPATKKTTPGRAPPAGGGVRRRAVAATSAEFYVRKGFPMAHLVRQRKSYFVDAEGKRCAKGTPGTTRVVRELRKRYGAAIPGFPPRKRVPLATDK